MESDQPLSDPLLASELAALLFGGEAVDARDVTIDQERALAKLHLYREAAPQDYVLELVRCACARGASTIEFAVDREDVRIFFDGTYFSTAELEHIHTAALGIGEPSLGLQALGRGLSMALALNPQIVRLLSGDEVQRNYLELRTTGLAQAAAVNPGKPGTLIQVRQRYGEGLRCQFRSERDGSAAEVASLREKCAHAWIPIFVNGEQISDPAMPPRLAGTVVIHSEELRGFAGFDPDRGGDTPPFARGEFLSGGVHLGGHNLPHFPPWFFARIDDLRLRSHRVSGEVVRDAAYNSMLDHLRKACDRALQNLASELRERLADDPDATIPEWQFNLLRNSLFLRAGEKPDDLLATDAVFAALADIELWERGNGEICSTRALLSDETLRFSHRPDDGVVPEQYLDVVFIEDDADTQFLTSLGAEDVSRALLRTREYEQNRRRFEQRRHAPRLADSYYLGRIPLQGDGVRGEVGLRGIGSQRCVCRLLLSGCLLRQQALEFPLPGLEVAVEAKFTPSSSYLGIHRNETLAYAVFEILCAVERLIAAVARAWDPSDLGKTRALFIPYIHAVAAPEFGSERLQEFGFSASSASRYIRKFGGPAYCPQWALNSDTPHPLATLPLFTLWDAPPCSLADISQHYRDKGPLPYLPYDFQTVASLPDSVLRLTTADRELVEAILGVDALIDFGPELSRLGQRATFMERPITPLELPQKFSPRVAIELEEVDGVLGLDRAWLRPERLSVTHARFEVLKYRRKLGHHHLQVLIPGIVGILNDDNFPVNELWNDFADDLDNEVYARLDRSIHTGLCSLLDEVATLCSEQPIGGAVELRRLALLTLAAVFDNPTVLQVYQRLVRQHDPHAAHRAFHELLGLFETHSRKRVLTAIGQVCEQEGPLCIDDIRQAAGRKRRLGRKSARAIHEEVSVRRALVSRVSKLLDLPVVRTTGGRPLSVHDLLLMYQQQGEIHYLGTDAPPAFYDGFERTIVVLGGSESLALSRLVGWDALSCAEDWLREKIARRDGQTPDLRRPALPVGERLVAIEVIDDGFEGQVGLRRWGPLRSEPTHVRLYRKRSAVGRFSPEHAFTVVGVLDHPDLEVDDHGRPTDAWATRIQAVLEATHGELIGRLLARWEDYNADELAVACRWVMHLLATRAPGAGAGGAAINRACEDPLVARLVNHPVWMTTRGTRVSLAQLADAAAQHGAQHYVTKAWVHEPPKVPVVVIEPDQRNWLEALFPTIVDHVIHWNREVLTLRRRSQAERLPALPPTNALEAVRVDTRGLKGWLWLLPNTDVDACIRLGLDGLEVERRQLSEVFACEGSVMGAADEIETGDNWGHLRLGRSQEAALTGCSLQLYRELIDTHEQALEQGGGPAVRLKGRSRRGLQPEVDTSAISRQLAALTLRLYRRSIERSGRLKSSYRRLLRRLLHRDLFELHNHRFVSLETVLHERPAELAHLGLWRTETTSGPVLSLRVRVTRTVAEEPRLPELPPPTREHQLLEAVRSELRLVNADPNDLQAETYFDRLSIASIEGNQKLVIERGGYLVVNLEHPVAKMALHSFDTDPLIISALTSCIFTDFSFRNRQEGERVLRFVSRHAEHVHSSQAVKEDGEEPAQ